MVIIKHNYLKSDIFFNPIFIPDFSGSRFLGSGSRVLVQVIEVALFNKLQVGPATLLKRGLWHRCFPVNFAKFLTPFHRTPLVTVSIIHP